MCAFYNDDQPLFGKLIDVIATKDLHWLIVKPYMIKKFNEHYNAFEIELQDNMECLVLQQENLADHHPLSISKSFDSTIQSDFVVLKYHVFA